MSKTAIMIHFVLYSLAWGVILGSLVGFLFHLAFLGPTTYGIFGFILGCISGMILGVINGLVLGIITLRFGNTLDNIEKYRNRLENTAFLLTFVVAILFFFTFIYFLTSSPIFALFIAIFASIFASISALYASRRVAKWYLDELALSLHEDTK